MLIHVDGDLWTAQEWEFLGSEKHLQTHSFGVQGDM
jgi:hypothetical protein